MTEPLRPSPDALLAALQNEATQGNRGRLKVFVGMCPGVGKTYAMLEAAQRGSRLDATSSSAWWKLTGAPTLPHCSPG